MDAASSAAVPSSGSLVAGVPGKVRRALTDTEYDRVVANAQIYLDLAARHRQTTG